MNWCHTNINFEEKIKSISKIKTQKCMFLFKKIKQQENIFNNYGWSHLSLAVGNVPINSWLLYSLFTSTVSADAGSGSPTDDRARTCKYCQYDGALRAWVESTAVRPAFCRVCGRRSVVRRLLLVCSDCVAARRRRRVLDAFSASPTSVFELFSTTLPDSDY